MKASAGEMTMHTISAFAQAVGTKLTVWLVNHGAPYVLAGTLGLAGIGAAIANPPAAGSAQNSVQSTNSHNPWQAAHHCHHYQDGDTGSFYAGY
jgi:hypothetical protein